eukprot:CAMPEP_0178935658 /NCGR_PEP_ID=MMETSP0786-20121207/24678_1 /TAXON_ID=186022 /ORGANISM="Thalassionema frauenfeldii, Strain CCMP 1798" /LENGTH=307 /DNA_ID=CAMNT_0020613851 /DNA_START=48 /DNA_END=971 /DNA_ORIENTATION=-
MTPRPQKTRNDNNNNDDDDDNNDDDNDVVSHIYLIRHGDRWDYANPSSWIELAKRTKNLVTDPSLSPLGHVQATETSVALLQDITSQTPKKKATTRILSSPYLRVIQTSVPTANALGLPICIEEGLSEAMITPGKLPSPSERFAYFPQIDTDYESILRVKATPGFHCEKTGYPCEAFAGKYVKRMEVMAKLLEEKYHGQTVVCFSHAASIALVAALLRCDLEGMKFAPCGIYHLVRKKGVDKWELVTDGSTNAPHVSENSETTYPWGFRERHFQEGTDNNNARHGSSEGIDLQYFVEDKKNANSCRL